MFGKKQKDTDCKVQKLYKQSQKEAEELLEDLDRGRVIRRKAERNIRHIRRGLKLDQHTPSERMLDSLASIAADAYNEDEDYKAAHGFRTEDPDYVRGVFQEEYHNAFFNPFTGEMEEY